MAYASTTWFFNLGTTNIVPLDKPYDWSKFLESMIEVPNFSLIL